MLVPVLDPKKARRTKPGVRAARAKSTALNVDPTKLPRAQHIQRHIIWNASLGVGGTLFDASASGRRIYFVDDTYRAREVTVNGAKEYWGVSVRLALGITTLDVKVKASLPFLAAQAEIGAASVNYELVINGYVGPVKQYLSTGVFNIEGYIKAMDSLQKAKAAILDDFANIEPVKLLEELPIESQDGELVAAVAMHLGLRAAADGRSYSDAVQTTPAGRYLTDDERRAIRLTYEVLGVMGDDTKPSRDARQKAGQILSTSP